MGSIGASRTIAVERQDLSGLSKTQREEMEYLYNKLEFARTHTQQEWALNQLHYTPERFERFPEDRDYMLQRADAYIQQFPDAYNRDRSGVLLTRANSSTLKALEKRGFIEIVKDGKQWIDHVKVIEKRKK